MDELLAKASQGVDPDSPDMFVHIFLNLLNLMPWAAMFWWSVVFVVVGGVLGWFRGRTVEGIVWAATLGPIGWIVLLIKPVSRPPTGPPPLGPTTVKPPPLKRPPLD